MLGGRGPQVIPVCGQDWERLFATSFCLINPAVRRGGCGRQNSRHCRGLVTKVSRYPDAGLAQLQTELAEVLWVNSTCPNPQPYHSASWELWLAGWPKPILSTVPWNSAKAKDEDAFWREFQTSRSETLNHKLDTWSGMAGKIVFLLLKDELSFLRMLFL